MKNPSDAVKKGLVKSFFNLTRAVDHGDFDRSSEREVQQSLSDLDNAIADAGYWMDNLEEITTETISERDESNRAVNALLDHIGLHFRVIGDATDEEQWCNENAEADFVIFPLDGVKFFLFRDPADAALFKMRWIGE